MLYVNIFDFRGVDMANVLCWLIAAYHLESDTVRIVICLKVFVWIRVKFHCCYLEYKIIIKLQNLAVTPLSLAFKDWNNLLTVSSFAVISAARPPILFVRIWLARRSFLSIFLISKSFFVRSSFWLISTYGASYWTLDWDLLLLTSEDYLASLF